MRKLFFVLILQLSIVIGYAQQDPYKQSSEQQKREWQATERHYESMKKSTPYQSQVTNQSTTPADLQRTNQTVATLFGLKNKNNAQQSGAGLKTAENKFREIVKGWGKIERTSRYYYTFREIGFKAGFDVNAVDFLIGKNESEFLTNAFTKNSLIASCFEKNVNNITPAGNVKPAMVFNNTPVTHNTQLGAGNMKHPVTFSEVNNAQMNQGYRQFSKIDEYFINILADGKNNYANITDKTTQYSNNECKCDAVYGLKYYFKNFNAMEYGVFQGPGWEFPFLRMYLKTGGEQETNEIFNDFVNRFSAMDKFTRYRSYFTSDSKEAYFEINNNAGIKYTVWIEKGHSNYDLRMGVDKKQEANNSGDPAIDFMDLLLTKKEVRTNLAPAINLQSSKVKTIKVPVSGSGSEIYNSLQIKTGNNEAPGNRDDKLNNTNSNNVPVYQTHLNNINQYLKTFDDGYYGHFEVKDDSLYLRFRLGLYSKVNIADIGNVVVEEANRKVSVQCKEDKKCVFNSYVNALYADIKFYQNKDFNTAELITLLNNLITALKTK